jgi:hypothetical protein
MESMNSTILSSSCSPVGGYLSIITSEARSLVASCEPEVMSSTSFEQSDILAVHDGSISTSTTLSTRLEAFISGDTDYISNEGFYQHEVLCAPSSPGGSFVLVMHSGWHRESVDVITGGQWWPWRETISSQESSFSFCFLAVASYSRLGKQATATA